MKERFYAKSDLIKAHLHHTLLLRQPVQFRVHEVGRALLLASLHSFMSVHGWEKGVSWGGGGSKAGVLGAERVQLQGSGGRGCWGMLDLGCWEGMLDSRGCGEGVVGVFYTAGRGGSRRGTGIVKVVPAIGSRKGRWYLL